MDFERFWFGKFPPLNVERIKAVAVSETCVALRYNYALLIEKLISRGCSKKVKRKKKKAKAPTQIEKATRN